MRYLTVILAVFLLTSCSVKKRTYRDGYYITWSSSKKNTSPLKLSEKVNNREPKEQIESVVITANTNNEEPDLYIPQKKNLLLVDTCGDIIFFHSGDQVRAKVMEITDDKIKYKRCDNLEGPLFVVKKGSVSMIRYVNGVEEKIEAPVEVSQPNTNNPTEQPSNNPYGNQPKKVHPYAWWALVATIGLSWLFGAGIVVGLILSSIAIKEITSNPKKWKGLMLAKVVRGFCYIIIGLLLLAIILSI